MSDRSALEEAIRADPDDREAYLVFADYLQSQGDPWGELITVMIELDGATGDEKRALEIRQSQLLSQNGHFTDNMSRELATVEWHWGFFSSARFENNEDWMDDEWDLVPVVRQVLDRPQAMLLRELRVGILRWMQQATDAPRLLEEVASLGLAANIETLRLGDVSGSVDLAHHPLGELAVIGAEFTRVRTLTLRGIQFSFDELPLPRLETCVVETCALGSGTLRSIVGREPRTNLERLELWTGSADYGCDVTAEDLAVLFDAKHFPALESLGIMNCEVIDDVCRMLPSAGILPQLKTLDLSLGTLTDDGVDTIVNNIDAFKHLSSFNVDDNYLSTDMVARLREALGPALTHNQSKEPDEYQGEIYRYVSYWE